MASFQLFGGASKWLIGVIAAAGLTIVGVLNLQNAVIKGSSVPVTNNTYDLGSPSSTWRHLYAKYVSSTAADFTGYVSTTRLILAKGSLSNPAIKFATGPTNSGLYMTTGGSVAFAINGAAQFAITPNTGITFATSSIPNYNNLSFGSTAWPWLHLYGVNVSSTNIDALGYVSTTRLKVPFGSNAAPSIAFIGDLGTGLSVPTAGSLDLNTSGGLRFRLSSSGNATLAGIYPGTNNLYDLGRPALSFGNIYSSSTIYGVNAKFSGTVTGTIATGRYELGRQGDVGSPFDWWHMYISAGVAGTRQHAIASIGDKSIMGMYCENSGVAQVCQNPSFNVFVPIKQGQPYKTTYNYAWTTDGCRAQINTNSSTAPTYAATSTSFCP